MSPELVVVLLLLLARRAGASRPPIRWNLMYAVQKDSQAQPILAELEAKGKVESMTFGPHPVPAEARTESRPQGGTAKTLRLDVVWSHQPDPSNPSKLPAQKHLERAFLL